MGEGTRFCVLHTPPAGMAMRGAILFIHPFAEEINKCRRMAALQSRAFAAAGWTVLQVDLFGCGDSSGEFSDVSWARWQEDVSEAARWLETRTGLRPVFWGVRAGCLLALQAARTASQPADLLFWQPVLSGKDHFTQFLRLKITGEMLRDASERVGAQQLREQLAQGDLLEVAGYIFSSALADGLEEAALDPSAEPMRVAWLEVTGSSSGELPPASARCVERWKEAGHEVSTGVVQGPAFWQTLGITECPALVDATLDAIQPYAR